ncbi:MAG TPA: nuclear transport factor 2 family protein [Magnetospirillaceae bacterium]
MAEGLNALSEDMDVTEIHPADKIAITELVARYNHAIDHQDAVTWANLFTEDGILITNDQIRAQGRTALLAYAQSAPPEGRSRRHWTSNVLIEIDGNTATLKAYVMVFNLAEGLSAPYLMAEYDDCLVKSDGQWRFRLRHMRVLAGRSFDDMLREKTARL